MRIRLAFWIICLFLILPIFLSLKSTKQITTRHNQANFISEPSNEQTKITILIDNYTNSTLRAPWGLSILIETANLTILFDAGPSPNDLQLNAEVLGINVSQLDLVVISHGHADHVEGLSYIAEENPNITVYVPIDMSSFVKQRIDSWNVTMVEIDTNYLIREDIAIIGPLYGPPNEQALTINVKGLGLIIFVGCSHPGVENLVNESINYFETQPYAVIGGFHLFEEEEEDVIVIVDELLSMNLRKIFPMHDCGDIIRNYLQTNYPSHYEEVVVGYSTTFRGNGIFTSSSSSSSSTPSFKFYFVIGGLISLFVTMRNRKFKIR